MRLRQDTSIGTQIILLPLVALVGFLVVLIIFFFNVQALQTSNTSSVEQTHKLAHIRQIEHSMTDARIAEKQFLLRQDLDDFQRVIKSIDMAMAAVEVLRKQHKGHKIEQHYLMWSRALKHYRNNFIDMASGLATIGVNETSGLRRTINVSTLAIEKYVQRDAPKLLQLFVILQRHQQAFAMDPSKRNTSRWRSAFDVFKHGLADADLTDVNRIVVLDSLRRYEGAFLKLQTLRKNISTTERLVDRNSATLAAAFTAESKREMAASLKESNANLEQTKHAFQIVVTLTTFIAIFVFIFGRWLAKGIYTPLEKMTSAMKDMANGALDVVIPVFGYKNQIGDMANALVKFRAHDLDRCQARLKMHEANRQTQNIIRSMNEALFEVAVDGRIVIANRAAGRLVGLDSSALTGRYLSEFLPDATPDQARVGFALLRSAIENLAENDPEKYRTVLKDAPLGMFMSKRDGTIIHANQKIAEIFAVEPSDIVGQNICEFMTDVGCKFYAKFLESGRSLDHTQLNAPEFDFHVASKDNWGCETNISVTPLNVRGEHGFLFVFQRVGIDPLYADMEQTHLGQMMSSNGIDTSVLQVIDPIEVAVADAPLLTRADGSQIAIRYSGALLRDRQNKVHGAICVIGDVSDWRTAEHEIMRFKSTVDHSSDAVFMFHPSTLKFIYLNDHARHETGWSEVDYMEKTPVDMNPMFSEDRFRMLTKPLVFGTQKVISLTTTGLSGGQIELNVELMDSDCNDAWFVVTTRDISSRIKAERESRQLRKTLDRISDDIFMYTPDTLKILYQNVAAKLHTGQSTRNNKNLTLMDVFPSFSKDEFLEQAEPLLSGREKQITYRKTGENGQPLEVNLQLIKPEGGEPRFVSIARDITDQLAAEKAKSNFVATVSHELRTPLTSIKGALGIIQAGAAGEMNDKLSSLISIASKNSDRLIRLINDILDIEKFEFGKMDMQLEKMDLCDLVKESITANNGYANAHGVKFQTVCPDTPVTVLGDNDRLMQVMANLMSNAAKFSKRGADIVVSLEQRGPVARISVADTGDGIPEKSQATIFDKFTQADSSDQRKKGGTGLGLNIVKHMIEAHGGTVDFVSTEGKGTTFFFEIKMLPDQSVSAEPESPPEIFKTRVLVCESNPEFAATLKLVLDENGYCAAVVNTLAQASAMLASGTFAGVMLDLEMPDGNGLEFLKELRTHESTRNMPVLIVSSDESRKKQRKIGKSIGVIDWFNMPLDETRLIDSLSGAVARCGAEKPIILHIEDDQNIRDIVETVIGENGDFCAAETIREAKQKLTKMRFDLVILDLNLPDGNGQDLLPLLDEFPQNGTPVIIFSADEPPAEVAAKVRAVLVKSKATNEEFLAMINRAVGKIDPNNHKIAAE